MGTFLQNGLLDHFFGEGTAFADSVAVGTVALLAGVILCIAAGYLIGSVNSAIIVSRVLYRDDVRRHGSGNAGTTNMLRTYGKKAALLTLLGDVFKTVLAIVFGGLLFGFRYRFGVSLSEGCYIAALFAVFGHVFPVYHHMKGGKGVLCTATAVLMLSPLVFALLFLVFVILVATSKYVSLGSVGAAFLYPVTIYAYFSVLRAMATGEGAENFGIPWFISLTAILLALLIIWCHRENLRRIGDRTENQFSWHKKQDKDEQEQENDDDKDDKEE